MVSVTVTSAPPVTLLYLESVQRRQLSVSQKEGNNKACSKYTDSGAYPWGESFETPPPPPPSLSKVKRLRPPTWKNSYIRPCPHYDFSSLSKKLWNNHCALNSLSVFKTIISNSLVVMIFPENLLKKSHEVIIMSSNVKICLFSL